MSLFMDRYLDLCETNNVKPFGDRAAKIAQVSKGTILAWKRNDNIPPGDVVANIATAFETTTDYLLGLSDHKYPVPQIYNTTDGNSNLTVNANATENGTVETTIHTTATPAAKDDDAVNEIRPDYMKLDPLDRARVQAYITGLLVADKYRG